MWGRVFQVSQQPQEQHLHIFFLFQMEENRRLVSVETPVYDPTSLQNGHCEKVSGGCKKFEVS